MSKISEKQVVEHENKKYFILQNPCVFKKNRVLNETVQKLPLYKKMKLLYDDLELNMSSSGQGVNPYRWYSPRAARQIR